MTPGPGDGAAMIRPSVLVTGSGNVTGLNVVRALVADGGIDVVGCDLEPWNPANRYCVNHTVPRATDPGYLDAILEIARRHGVGGVIASNDHEVRALSSNVDRLAAAGVALNGSCANHLLFLDKGATAALFEAHGIPTPRRVPLDGSVPIVVRKRFVGDGPKLVRVVRTAQEYDPSLQLSADELIATEFITGAEYTVDILSDLDGRVLSVVPRVRHVVRNGIVVFGETAGAPALLESASVLATRLGLTGINCVQCIGNDEGYFYFEVNGRPGSGIDLTVAAGVNMPALWARMVHGQTVHAAEPTWGLKLVRTYDGYFFR